MKKDQTKTGRNDPCPCGSGLKYKKCCMRKRKTLEPESMREIYFKRYKIRLKEPADIAAIRRAGVLVMDTLDLVESALRPGMATEEINTLVHEYTLKRGAVPATLNYRGYPASVCVSVNEVICHGIPGKRIIQDGDIVNVDITSILDGYYADANKTFLVGTGAPDAEKIIRVARESLKRGIEMVRPGNTVGEIGRAHV